MSVENVIKLLIINELKKTPTKPTCAFVENVI